MPYEWEGGFKTHPYVVGYGMGFVWQINLYAALAGFGLVGFDAFFQGGQRQ